MDLFLKDALLLYFYHWDLSGSGAVMTDRLTAGTLFWIPVICIMLLGAVIANVMLFQNVVQYHEENRKCTLLEN